MRSTYSTNTVVSR